MSEQDLQSLPPSKRPLIIQQKQSVKPVYVNDEAMPAKQNHAWSKETGYMETGYTHQEFPKALYRTRTKEEIDIERENITFEMWMSRGVDEIDLLLLTGHNQKRNKQFYEAWVNRHVDAVANDAKQEAAMRKEGFKSLAEHQPK